MFYSVNVSSKQNNPVQVFSLASPIHPKQKKNTLLRTLQAIHNRVSNNNALLANTLFSNLYNMTYLLERHLVQREALLFETIQDKLSLTACQTTLPFAAVPFKNFQRGVVTGKHWAWLATVSEDACFKRKRRLEVSATCAKYLITWVLLHNKGF